MVFVIFKTSYFLIIEKAAHVSVLKDYTKAIAVNMS